MSGAVISLLERMRSKVQRIGNSRGVILPKPLLEQLELADDEVDISLEGDAIVVRKPKKHLREGWAEAAAAMATAGGDDVIWPDFGNDFDSEWSW